MPLKWPAEHEPVIPDYTDVTVCVAGLSALGCRTADVVYNAGELPERLSRDIVDMNMMHAVISSRSGGQKGVRGEFRVFLNQVDDDIDRLASAYRLQQILGVMGIQSAWGSLKAEDPRIAVVMEAAGDSKRFGSNKLLHVMDDGRPMIASVLDAVRGIEAYKKILVTQYDEVASLAADMEIVMNDRPDLGISRSMQLGLEAGGDADAFMFCVCDQPGLSSDTLQRLVDAYKKGTAGIVSLAWQGKMCNPKIFSSRYKEELMRLSGDTGGRQIIAAHPDDILLVEAESEDEVTDIDSL
jgi:molybdenum cofactor cytidylyltransferase